MEFKGDPKAIIEAALFAAGKTLTVKELSDLADIGEEAANSLAEELSREYSERKSGIEIRAIEDRYVMQVRGGLAREVMAVAPKEIDAPLIRTLAIIAYKQPIKQSYLAEIRGNKVYDHVKELERMGLISRARVGRTKVITTTKAFADYFGLSSDQPDYVRHVILKSARPLGVTKMYESLALKLGLDYILINPYHPGDEDQEKLKDLNVLVAAPGYADTIKEHYSGDLIEAEVKTLSQLKESAEKICVACSSGNPEPLAKEIDDLLAVYRGRAKSVRAVRPLTVVVECLAKDLRIPIRDDGITAASDSSKATAQIQVPAHQPYDLDILERIKQRCEVLLTGLAWIKTSPSS